jgi:hypothetical protein
MCRSNRTTFCAAALLAAGLCCTGSSFAQKPTANSNAQATVQAPIKPLTNPNQARRQAAMDQFMVAVAARAQVEPQFAAYVRHVNNYNDAMAAFVKARKGGVK